MALAKEEEDEDNKEAHKRIIELSNLMQYDDDIDESRVKESAARQEA